MTMPTNTQSAEAAAALAAPTPRWKFLTMVLLTIVLSLCTTAAGVYNVNRAGLLNPGSVIAVVLMGIVVGIVFSLINSFMKGRWAFANPFDQHEHNYVQTAVSAVTSGAGMCAPLVAMALLGGGSEARLSPWEVLIFMLPLGVMGVLISVPLRQRYVVQEQLPFPSGRCTFEVIKIVKGIANRGIVTLFTSTMLGGFGISALQFFQRIPEMLLPGTLGSFIASPEIIGIGAMVGMRVTFWMAVAGIGLTLIAPTLQAVPEIAAYLATINITTLHGDNIRQYVLWVGVPMIFSGGMCQLLIHWKSLKSAFTITNLGASWWRSIGLVSIAIVIIQTSMGLPWWGGVIGVFLTLFLAPIGARFEGYTDINPVSSLSGATQFLVGAVPGATMVHTCQASATTCFGASLAGNTMQDLTTGFALETPYKRQLKWQYFGALLGPVVLALIWEPMWKIIDFGSDRFPAPMVIKWKAIAEVAAGSKLPPFGWEMLWIGLASGALLVIIEHFVRTRFCNGRAPIWLPSVIGICTPFILPASMAKAYFVGAIVGTLAQRFCRKYDLIPKRVPKPGEEEPEVHIEEGGVIVGGALYLSGAFLFLLALVNS